LLEQVLDITEKRVRPRVRMDTREITHDDVQDGRVGARPHHGCVAGTAARVPLEPAVDRRLRQELPKIRGVEQV
jgi:Fe-S cluster biogenesis protein NfuA